MLGGKHRGGDAYQYARSDEENELVDALGVGMRAWVQNLIEWHTL